MVKLYLVRTDLMGIGYYSYGEVYYNKDWAQIECNNHSSFDTDAGRLDSVSDILEFDIPVKNDECWMVAVYDGGDTVFVFLYPSENEALDVQRTYIKKGYHDWDFENMQNSHVSRKKIILTKPRTYMEIMKER